MYLDGLSSKVPTGGYNWAYRHTAGRREKEQHPTSQLETHHTAKKQKKQKKKKKVIHKKRKKKKKKKRDFFGVFHLVRCLR
jgi:hypothetical protein